MRNEKAGGKWRYIEKGKRLDEVQTPEPAKLPQASQHPAVSTVPQSSTTRTQANPHDGIVAFEKRRELQVLSSSK